MRPATPPSSAATNFTAAALPRVALVASLTRETSSAVSMVRKAGFIDGARDLLGGGALLGDGGRDRAADGADFADDSLDRADGVDRAHGGPLHAGDLGADLVCGLGGLSGRRLHLVGNHGK